MAEAPDKTFGGNDLQERAQREVDAYNDLVTSKIPQAQQVLQQLEQERLQRLGKIQAYQELLQEINPEGDKPPGLEVQEPPAAEGSEGGEAEVPAQVAEANGHSEPAAKKVQRRKAPPRAPRRKK